MKALQLFAAMLILSAITHPVLAGQEPAPASLQFSARMTADQVVPAVSSRAQGMLHIRSDEEGSVLFYTLRVSGVMDIGQVAIYNAPAGQRGAMLVQLAPSKVALPCMPQLDGSWCQCGVIREGDVAGSLAKLVEAMLEGNVYAEARTAHWPQGEIRGQILPLWSGFDGSFAAGRPVSG